MDKTMTRRIIGAIVLVLVVALILAALLRGKSKQSDVDMVDVSSPAEPILQFPDDTAGDGTADMNQDLMGQRTSPEGDDKVGFDVTQSGVDTTGVQVPPTGSTQSTPSSEVISEEKPAPKKPEPESREVNLSEKDKLDLDGKSDKVSPTPAQEEAKLVKEPKLPPVNPKPKQEPKEEKSSSVAEVIEDLTGPADGEGAETGVPVDGYSIQLIATKDQAKAERIMKQMIGEGYPAYVAPVMVNGASVYRVRIGSYPDKAEAESVQARMKRRYTKNQMVHDSKIYSN